MADVTFIVPKNARTSLWASLRELWVRPMLIDRELVPNWSLAIFDEDDMVMAKVKMIFRRVQCTFYGHEPKCWISESGTKNWKSRVLGHGWCAYCASFVREG